MIENRGGAGGNIGADAVAKADPDGYTVVMGTVGTHAINASLYAKMPYDPLTDFAPVAYVAGVPNLMVVNLKNVKANTVQEFIAEAKSAPRKFNMASSGNGTSIHLSGELFKQITGVEMPHVPYRERPGGQRPHRRASRRDVRQPAVPRSSTPRPVR